MFSLIFTELLVSVMKTVIYSHYNSPVQMRSKKFTDNATLMRAKDKYHKTKLATSQLLIRIFFPLLVFNCYLSLDALDFRIL